jgi:DinB family protein
VQGNPAAQDELRRLGVPRVPAVAIGERVVHGWNPEAYARLVGVDYTAPRQLAPQALASRLDAILAAAERLTRALPADRLGWKPAERDRTLGDLAFHVFRVGGSFADAMDLGGLPETWFSETAPADLADGPAIARYGALVRGRLAGWFEGASETELARDVQTYYGPQSAHDFLERTTWHAAQHLRQLHVLCARIEVTPPEPLDPALLNDLPLPASIW